MNNFEQIKTELLASPKSWLITGVAGFIGSNLLESLLKLNQKVSGLDNFSTGYQRNLDEVQSLVSAEQWANFTFHHGDIRNINDCQSAVKDMDYILHQAALGSVPRSINDPATSNEVNITGQLNMLIAARDEQVSAFVYAASSSTYGDHPALPKQENNIGNPLSPYAVTKYVNELYARVFQQTYGLKSTGLRYFNVFGPRQDPNGAYAAVIPRWAAAIIKNEPLLINGDGQTSRDFCFINNAVQANILAAINITDQDSEVFNVACNARTSLNELKNIIYQALHDINPDIPDAMVEYRDFRVGDVRHSQADISKAYQVLGYQPGHQLREGISQAMPWYLERFS